MWRSALFFPSCSLLPTSALSRVYLRFRFPSLLDWDTEYGMAGRGTAAFQFVLAPQWRAKSWARTGTGAGAG